MLYLQFELGLYLGNSLKFASASAADAEFKRAEFGDVGEYCGNSPRTRIKNVHLYTTLLLNQICPIRHRQIPIHAYTEDYDQEKRAG